MSTVTTATGGPRSTTPPSASTMTSYNCSAIAVLPHQTLTSAPVSIGTESISPLRSLMMQRRMHALLIAMAVLPCALAAQASTAAPATAPAPSANPASDALRQMEQRFARILAAAAAPAPAPAPSANPVSDALRQREQPFARILVAAAEAMPADKYNYRPTPGQMSFAAIQVHLANEGNDLLCGKVAGTAAPQRAAPVDSTAGKDALVARLRETFQFCEQAFAKLDDSKLSTPIQLFGPNPFTLASAMFITVGDWADHYSQEANYLRLNGILPPTAQPRRGMMPFRRS